MQLIYWLYLCYCVGSFLTVIVGRWQLFLAGSPLTFKTLFSPPSHCTRCQNRIAWYDNIPLLSYAILRGRCRHCQQPIGLQYLLIECATLLFSLVVIYLLNSTLDGIALFGILFFTWLLVALAAIDLLQGYLPDRLTYLLLWSGLLYAAVTRQTDTVQAIFGASVGYLSLWLVSWIYFNLRKREGMGFGDFKLTAALGAWIGVDYLIPMIWLAAVLALIIFLLHYLRYQTLPITLPFGPYLALSGWLIMVMQLWDKNLLLF